MDHPNELKQQAPVEAEPAAMSKSFRLVSKSDNVNSFGLRNYVFLARDGYAFEAARPDGYYHGRGFVTDGEYSFPIAEGILNTVNDGFELFHRLPDAPADVINEVWRKPATAKHVF